ncbi:hypothetical protein D3C74_428870 [compost metagenome]
MPSISETSLVLSVTFLFVMFSISFGNLSFYLFDKFISTPSNIYDFMYHINLSKKAVQNSILSLVLPIYFTLPSMMLITC